MSTPERRDDHIFRATKWLSAIIIPFLLIAFYILYLRPFDTKQLFAWEVKPRMTAMMLAAVYFGGAFFFFQVLRASRWHQVGSGFLPVIAFASLMGIATILHWDRFSHDNVSFYVWTLLYLTTPFLVLAAWLRNRRTDPGTPEPHDILLPSAVRYAVGALGLIPLAIGLLLFIQPTLMIAIWPWTLTPLTARVLSGMFALPGVLQVAIAVDRRWSSARISLQSQEVAIALTVLAAFLSWDNFNQANVATWIFMGGMIILLVGLPILYLAMETRLKRDARK